MEATIGLGIDCLSRESSVACLIGSASLITAARGQVESWYGYTRTLTAYEERIALSREIGSVANGSRSCIPTPYGPHANA
jgi:hypothetical protein